MFIYGCTSQPHYNHYNVLIQVTYQCHTITSDNKVMFSLSLLVDFSARRLLKKLWIIGCMFCAFDLDDKTFLWLLLRFKGIPDKIPELLEDNPLCYSGWRGDL